MKLRESGMPEETYWESLFDIPLILDRLGINSSLGDVSELGSGYGTFTIPVAKRISGVIETIDIDPAMIERTRQRVQEARLSNVRVFLRDVLKEGFPGADGSKDACLLFNILHGEEPLRILREAARAVRPDGFVFIIHWRWDVKTPRGPSPQIRPKPEQIIEWASEIGLLHKEGEVINLPPWHFGLRLSV